MKTPVLWVIQQNTLSYWCPQNLLADFWVCFKLLLKWVYEGICPNFFIPQNNLFVSKKYGSAQRSLFLQLHELYRKGLSCLLQCSSMRSFIINVLYNPRLSICIDENIWRCKVECDEELFNASNVFKQFYQDRRLFGKSLSLLKQLKRSPLTKYQAVHMQKLTVDYLQLLLYYTNFTIQNVSTNRHKLLTKYPVKC